MGAFLVGMLVPRVNGWGASWVCSRDSLGWLGYHERHRCPGCGIAYSRADLHSIWYCVRLLVPGAHRATTRWIGLAEAAAYRASRLHLLKVAVERFGVGRTPADVGIKSSVIG